MRNTTAVVKSRTHRFYADVLSKDRLPYTDKAYRKRSPHGKTMRLLKKLKITPFRELTGLCTMTLLYPFEGPTVADGLIDTVVAAAEKSKCYVIITTSAEFTPCLSFYVLVDGAENRQILCMRKFMDRLMSFDNVACTELTIYSEYEQEGENVEHTQTLKKNEH